MVKTLIIDNSRRHRHSHFLILGYAVPDVCLVLARNQIIRREVSHAA